MAISYKKLWHILLDHDLHKKDLVRIAGISEYMDVLGCKLKPMDPKHQWINEALHVMYPQSIYAVQEYLEPYGVDLGVDYGLELDL